MLFRSMEVPPDLWVNGKPPVDEDGDEVVCKLQRGLYGLIANLDKKLSVA